MERVGLTRLSWAEKNDLWRRWQRGESYKTIADALRRAPESVRRVVVGEGGVAPNPRRRSRLALTTAEREEISRGLATGLSLRGLARALNRAPSTLSREIRRNQGRSGYRASRAEHRAWCQSCRPKPYHLARCPALRRMVARKLAVQWSPQQIAHWLRHTFPSDAEMHVSHETIYRSLFVQSRGLLKRTLLSELRRPRSMRRSRYAAPIGQRQLDIVSIRERPAEVDDRAVPGHWEADLLTGAGPSFIATLVERQSRYVILLRLPNKEARTVVQALTRRIQQLPAGLVKSLTVDRGGEFGAHRQFTMATNVKVYFCDPQSPWQRGSNENTNGLLRQYLPRRSDLSSLTQTKLDAIALRLNTRPRMTLGYKTPAAKLSEIVASTG
jgi:IS30 family transposase